VSETLPAERGSNTRSQTLESNQDQGPVDIPDEMREMTVNHIKQWVADINSLLKEYTAHRL